MKEGGGHHVRLHVRVTGLRRFRQLGADVLEDRLDAAARRRHRANRDERDERNEQRVLEQVLSSSPRTNERTALTNFIGSSSTRRSDAQNVL